jgi:predicted enzyme related to lactoylglutathione lyase
VEQHVRRLVEAGGRVLAERTELGESWVVMADPEGNEFCVQ